jgi:hypothetical protein
VSEGKTLVPEGKPLVSEGKTLVPEGKPLVSEGKTLVSEGKTLVSEGKTLVSEGKTLVSEGKTLVPEQARRHPWHGSRCALRRGPCWRTHSADRGASSSYSGGSPIARCRHSACAPSRATPPSGRPSTTCAPSSPLASGSDRLTAVGRRADSA